MRDEFLHGQVAIFPQGGENQVLRIRLRTVVVDDGAFLIVDENDVLRDEGEACGRKLVEAGVRVTSVRYSASSTIS
ncbi:MAG TPA: alpha/beta hydrolase fold domain-containing protein [Microbacteriaceae bacterium]|jgi:acetyl esterase/lipase|nr:alpha/beta hydrolase fold domain-containing protein [Microbacteriaceae bacterium]